MNERKKSLVKYILWLLLAGLFGGTLSFLTDITKEHVLNIGMSIQSFLIEYSYFIGLLISALIILLNVFCYLKAKNLFRRWDGEDDLYIEKVEFLLSIAITSNSAGIIILLTFMGIFILKSPASNNIGCFLFCLLLFLLFSLFFVYICRKTIDLQKEINPEKKGDVLDLNFSKKWIESCDELEKMIIYKSSYKAYTISQKLFMVAFIFLILLSNIIDIGVYPYLLIGGIWLIESMVYSISCIQLSKSKHKKDD